MPIQDTSGATSNLIGVLGQKAAMGMQRRQQVVGGITNTIDALGDHVHKQKATAALVSAGFSPEEAQSLVDAGPEAAAQAMIQKRRDHEQRQQQMTDTSNQFAREDAQNGFSGGKFDPVTGTYSPGTYDASADPMLKREQTIRTTPTWAETQAQEEQKKYRSALSGAFSPAPSADSEGTLLPDSESMDSPNFKQNTSFRTPDVTEIVRSMGQKGFKYDPPSDLWGPKTQAPRNIDPLSKEGIDAAVERTRREKEAENGVKPPLIRGKKETNFDTPLSPSEEQAFQAWKAKYAPTDSGYDYDLRGAFKAGLTPDPQSGHWPDTFKKPNHPTFSNQSIYAVDAPEMAGTWNGDNYIPPPSRRPEKQVKDPNEARDALKELKLRITDPRDVAELDAAEKAGTVGIFGMPVDEAHKQGYIDTLAKMLQKYPAAAQTQTTTGDPIDDELRRRGVMK